MLSNCHNALSLNDVFWVPFRNAVCCSNDPLQNPAIGTLFCLRRVLILVILYYTGLLPFVPLRESFYEILMPSILLKSVHFAYRTLHALWNLCSNTIIWPINRENRFQTSLSSRQKLLIRFFDLWVSWGWHVPDQGFILFWWAMFSFVIDSLLMNRSIFSHLSARGIQVSL